MNNKRFTELLLSSAMLSGNKILGSVRQTFKRVCEIDRALERYQLTEAEKERAKKLAETTPFSYIEAIRRVWILREDKSNIQGVMNFN